ncbi:ficolin-2-like isoform 2-T2 [Cochliomyia hominivorax]
MNFLIILSILAFVQNIKSETASANTALTTKNSEPEAIVTAVKERLTTSTVPPSRAPSPPPPPSPVVEFKVYDDRVVKRNISDLNKRQAQQELFLKLLMEDVAFIKRYLIKIINQNPDWTVILRREDGSEDFFRTWDEYKEGFGNTKGEFFIGLENLHEMTSGGDQELLIILEDFESKTRYAKYDKFVVGSEDDKYAILELGGYSGDAGDSLSYHRTRKFSTKDQDNDNNPSINCAKEYKGGWWFDNCYSSHLTGPYLKGARSCRGGINWYHWRNYLYSLKFVEMMIRSIPDSGE